MRRVTTRGNVHPHARPRFVRRRPVPRVARSLRANPTPRAIPRRLSRDLSPAPIVASPTRRRIRARRIRARRAMAWNPSVARVEARVERLRARDSRFATDRRVVLNAAGSRASRHASRSRSRVVACGVARVFLRLDGRPASRDRIRYMGRRTVFICTLRTYSTSNCAIYMKTSLPARAGPLRVFTTPPRGARGDGSRRRRRRRRCSRSARRRSRPAARRWRRERARARRAPRDARRRARGFRSTSSTAKSETTCLG